jgi:hypothetical protein
LTTNETGDRALLTGAEAAKFWAIRPLETFSGFHPLGVASASENQRWFTSKYEGFVSAPIIFDSTSEIAFTLLGRLRDSSAIECPFPNLSSKTPFE